MSMSAAHEARQVWDEAWQAQIAAQAFNTAAVEALVRNIAYYLRTRPSPKDAPLHFLEIGSGAGPNLLWLARKGIRVSGIDISSSALDLCRTNLREAGVERQVDVLAEASAAALPFPNASFDGVVEACVLQHLRKDDRAAAFAEVRRVLKPGGLFAGYMLDVQHTVFQQGKQELPGDPGTLSLHEQGPGCYLTNLGICHFFRREEFEALLHGFSVVDPCLTSYELPRSEAERRGYTEYRQSMWSVYAIK
jgi:ubiquinone/menaquinone biosynthesis C-methylase UbiE